MTAPHTVQSANGEASKEQSNTIQRIDETDASTEPTESNSDARSWWFNSDDRTFKGTNKNGPAFGFDDSIRALEQAWQVLGPFQGILGFSQGACLVGLVCNLSMRGSKQDTFINSEILHFVQLPNINFSLMNALSFDSDHHQSTVCNYGGWFSFGQFSSCKLLRRFDNNTIVAHLGRQRRHHSKRDEQGAGHVLR